MHFSTTSFKTSLFYNTNTHFHNSLINIGSIYFLSSFDMDQFHHLLRCHTIGIDTSFNIFFKFFAFFKLNMISQKSDKNNTIRITSSSKLLSRLILSRSIRGVVRGGQKGLKPPFKYFIYKK